MTLYAVRNKDGQYFHNKGFGGCGKTWVDGLTKARIYARPGPARAQVTYFAKTYPEYGVPKLVELHVTQVVEVDETKRIAKVKTSREIRVAKEDARRRKHELVMAQRQAEEANERLRKAQARAADPTTSAFNSSHLAWSAIPKR
jgi:hypothetical protein